MMQAERAVGTMLGLACGDALGRPVEFKSATSIERKHGTVTEMLDDGTHGKPAGTLTDDTELAMCIATSLRDSGGFDPTDVAQRFVAWYDSNPFDVGLMTADTLRRLDRGESWDVAGREIWESRPEGQNAGNGSVMRCVPYAIAFADDPDRLEKVSRTSSAITHADPRCTYGCAILNRTLAELLTGGSQPLKVALDEIDDEVPDELTDALRGLPEDIDPNTLQSSGYVVHTLQTALYHGLTADDPREGIVTAVNMGRDTDTVGAVTGAILGARFGEQELPDSWVQKIRFDDEGRKFPDWWPDEPAATDPIRDVVQALMNL